MDKITALITGASRGIGFAIASRIVPNASTLLITAQHAERIARAKCLLDQICAANIVTMVADHANPQQAAKDIGIWARQHLRHLDLLVLNAGYYVEGELQQIESSDFEQNLRINFTVNHYLVQELLPLIQNSTLRRIVFIGSTAAYEAYPAVPSYGVAKWALRGYAANLRRELISKNIGVTFLAPGGTLTDMWAGEELPQNRLLEPDDIAKMIATILTLSPQAVVEEVILRPILGDLHE